MFAKTVTAWRDMALGKKFNLVFLLVGLFGLTAAALSLDRTVRPPFEIAEEQAASDQLARAGAVLTSAGKFAEDSTVDYGYWTATYDYILDNNLEFEQENAAQNTLVYAGINALAYARFDGAPRMVRYVDLGTGKQNDVYTQSIIDLVRDPQMRAKVQHEGQVSGFINIDGKLLAATFVKVFRTDKSGTPEGFVMMAKELSAREVSDALRTPANVRIGSPPKALVRGDKNWRIARSVAGIDGKPVGYIEFAMARDITERGRGTLRAALLATGLVLLLVLGSIYFAVRQVVVRRIKQIDSGVAEVADGAGLIQLRHDPSEDELGSLNHNFNRMVAQLKNLQEQIEVQSFELGREESKAGVLHNVRNSLNPVSVIIGQAISEGQNVSPELQRRALAELTEGPAEPQRRKQLAAFIQASLDERQSADLARRGSMQAARAALAEAMEILASSNRTKPADIPLEIVDLSEVLARNAQACRFVPWGEITISLPDCQMSVYANRLLLSQVIANLMTNATEAMIRANRKPGCLTVSVDSTTDATGGQLTLIIADDGDGFDPAIASRLFERGETSKHNKGGGLGLHWCANTLRAMGGALRLESDGPGKGARAFVELKTAA